MLFARGAAVLSVVVALLARRPMLQTTAEDYNFGYHEFFPITKSSIMQGLVVFDCAINFLSSKTMLIE